MDELSSLVAGLVPMLPNSAHEAIASLWLCLGALTTLVVALKGVAAVLVKLADMTSTKADDYAAASFAEKLDWCADKIEWVRSKVEVLAAHRAPKAGPL